MAVVAVVIVIAVAVLVAVVVPVPVLVAVSSGRCFLNSVFKKTNEGVSFSKKVSFKMKSGIQKK